MSVISALVPTTRRPGRLDVVVDGSFLATLSFDAIERLHLAVGIEVDGVMNAIAAEAAQLAVYDRALNMLAFRARSASELARLLVRKGAERADVDRAIARLHVQGLLDDASFAQAFTRAKVQGANMSRRRVQQELVHKGVARDIAEAAISAVFEAEGIDQRELVQAAALKKAASLARLDPVVRRRRLYAFLARRGYDVDDIRHAMQMVGEQLAAAEDAGADG